MRFHGHVVRRHRVRHRQVPHATHGRRLRSDAEEHLSRYRVRAVRRSEPLGHGVERHAEADTGTDATDPRDIANGSNGVHEKRVDELPGVGSMNERRKQQVFSFESQSIVAREKCVPAHVVSRFH